MKTPYLPINCSFHDVLLEYATRKKYCKIQYFTEIRELVTVHSLIKDVFTAQKEEFAVLVQGERIRLDHIISVDGIISPTYAYFEDFTCDC